MSRAILLYLAAGAALVGGPAAAVLLFRCGHQEAAAHTQARDAEKVALLLRTHIDLARLPEQARAVGVNPDLVKQGYHDVRHGLVTFDQMVAWMGTLGDE